MRYNNYRYIYCKEGIYYFTRRIPKSLQEHYVKSKIVFSLRTKSPIAAQKRATQLAHQLDEQWELLRWRDAESIFSRFSSKEQRKSSAPTLTESAQIYLEQKANGRPKTFESAVHRCIKSFIDIAQDKPIDLYTREDVNKFRDHGLMRGLSASSLIRNLNTLRALTNFTARERGIPPLNTFTAVYIANQDKGVQKRKAIPLNTILDIQKECLEINDEARRIIALLSDSGMRLSEALGLTKADIKSKNSIMYMTIKNRSWRRLKNKTSERIIPLVGASLVAIQESMKATNNEFLFPKYCNEDELKANSASATLNKWLKKRVSQGCVIHSFRHSFRDRLRSVECPTEIIDSLGGWSKSTIGEKYGEGYPIEILFKWIKMIKEDE